ncbi:MAG: LacI family DNA-binding transcriptional regulator [Caldilineaceae bacterium]
MTKQITLADIAQESQVSPSTVSLALRNKPGIPAETRQRILETARSLGYRLPGKNARDGETIKPVANIVRRLPHNRALTFGLIVKTQPGITPQANPFYSQVLAGIADACGRSQINLLYALVPVDDHNLPTEIPQLLNEDRVDGLLFVGAFIDKTLDHLLEERLNPVVLVDGYSESGLYDAVVSDNDGGAYEAVCHLIEHGHREIGIIGSQPDAYPSILERRNGYCQALQQYGIANRYFGDCNFDHTEIAAATQRLLIEQPQISALFCCNDAAALSAMRAAQALGRKIPTDLSVIGFDDIDSAQHVTPPLTTLHVDKVKMGRLAIQLLMDRIEFSGTAQTTVVLRPQLIKRASVSMRTWDIL